MNLDAGVQLDLLGALQRRLTMIVVITGVMLLGAYWVAMALPNYYSSSATIFVEPQAINQRLVESGTATVDLSYRLGMMTSQILSRPRLSRVIDEVGLYEQESKSMLREEVIQLMRSRIRVVPVEPELAKKGRDAPPLNTFRVSFIHKKPRLAAAVAQRLANDFIEEHVENRVGMTRKSLEFIDGELQRLTSEQSVIGEQIKAIKEDNPGRLPEDLASNQRTLDRTLGELRGAHRTLDEARSNQSFWDNQALAASALGDPRDDASPARRLQLLELQVSEYRARGFTEKHPDFIRAVQEIQQVRAQIVAAEGQQSDDYAPTPAEQNAEAQRERAELSVEMATKELERLRAAADEIQDRIAATPVVAERLNELEARAIQLNRSIGNFSDRRLRARVQVNVERRQLGEQFRILEAAFPAPTPTSPNRFLIIVMGLLVGLAIGVGGAVLAEATDSSFRVVRDVQSTLSIPVLAAIPDIVLESDRIRQRRRFLRNGLVASLVVVFCLAGGAATYMYVNGLPGWLNAIIEEEQPEDGEETALRAGPDYRRYRGELRRERPSRA